MGKDTRPACMYREVRAGRRRNKPEGDLLAAMYLAGVRVGAFAGEFMMMYDDRSGVYLRYADRFIDLVWGSLKLFAGPADYTNYAREKFAALSAATKMKYLRGPGGGS